MRQMLSYLFVALFGCITVGHAANSPNTSGRDAKGFLSLSVAVPESSPASSIATNSETESSLTVQTYLMDDKHKLMPNDRVSFLIKEDKTNALQLIVTDSTELDIPYIGRVSVLDKTCKQLAQEVKVALEKEYYHHATVTIGVDAMGKVVGKVLVTGAVKEPGAVDIPPNENFTASRAIFRARGFGDFANKKKVTIFRSLPNGQIKTIKVNLENVIEKGKFDEDVTLEPDDNVFVPKRAINW